MASQCAVGEIQETDITETVTPFDAKHEKMTKEEMVEHLKEKIEWIKNMPADEKQALIDSFVWKIERIKDDVGAFLEKLPSRQKQKLQKLHDSIVDTVTKIKSMSQEEKAAWKKVLKEELDDLKLESKIAALKNDPQMQEIVGKINRLIDWLEDISKNKNDKESLRELLVKKIDHMKHYIPHLVGYSKYDELKGKIEGLKEEALSKAHQKVDTLKAKILELHEKVLDVLEQKK